MRFSVEAWAPEYGAAVDAPDLGEPMVDVDATIEIEPSAWTARTPSAASPPRRLAFLDGVRRIDARVWIAENGGPPSMPGICATYAAGSVVVEDDAASIGAVDVHRNLFTKSAAAQDLDIALASYPVRIAQDDTPEGLALAVQDCMLLAEAAVARDADADLVVVDGPLRQAHPGGVAVGYVKTHRVAYLSTELMAVVGALEPGQRSPMFLLTGGRLTKLSWYVQLPGPRTHQLAGVVRCEQVADVRVAEAVARADLVTSLLPRFASEPHKDPRAPQNLYPVAGLERELRRRSGDPRLLEKALRRSAG